MNATELTKTLWLVDDVYPVEIVKACQEQDIESYPWIPLQDSKYSQAHRPRRVLDATQGIFAELNNHIVELLPQVKELTKLSISNLYTDVWADYEGYTIPMHIDNDAIYITMQIYLTPGDINLGTTFGEHTIPYKPNTGYLMVNSSGGYHGMRHTVPKDFIRLSSYTRFLR